jgi:O-antigen/teichoic acid export membrane protein
LFLGGAAALILAVFGGPVVRLLYGAEYLPAVRPMYVLLAGVVMVGVTRVLMRYFTSVNRHEHNVYIVATSLAVNVTLNLVLIPRFGIMGAAAASLATYVLQGVWALILFTRITRTGLRETLVVGAADARYVMKLAMKGRAHLRPARSSAPL